MKGLQEVVSKNAGKYEQWDDSYGRVIRNVRYGQRSNEVYDITIPKNVKNGVMVFIHGGSWMGGDKEWMEYACRRYAKLGYVTATMNYSFINDKKEKITLPIIDEEVMSCVKNIKEFLDKEGTKVNNLAVGGHSAGGQLAGVFAMKHLKDCPIPIRFAVVECGPVTITKMFGVNEKKLENIRKDMKAGKFNSKEKEEVDNFVMVTSGERMEKEMYYKDKVEELIK